MIIGYGKKVSYANGKHRELDLNQTFELLIQPVFEDLGIECYRALDKNITGNIDALMLNEIKDADIALADLSTLNANVMWELGVRHALKENYTIMISEQEQMSTLPFDINHYPVYSYVHSEAGIPYNEVERFRKQLKELVEKMLAQNPPGADSPVFEFVKPDEGEKEISGTKEKEGPSFHEVIVAAEKAKEKNDFLDAFNLYSQAKAMVVGNITLKDNLNFVVSRMALCLHKASPGDERVLRKALDILSELKPKNSTDTEVIGISGGINKRLHQITKDDKYLIEAIWFYERGFKLKQDYFNGINAVFMLYLQATELEKKKKHYSKIKTKADYINNEVQDICEALEEEEDFEDKEDDIWILYTLGEVHHYLGDEKKQKQYEKKGDELAKAKKNEFASFAYHEQKDLIDKDINLKLD